MSRPRSRDIRANEDWIIRRIDQHTYREPMSESTRPCVPGFRMFEAARFRIMRNLALMELFDAWPIVRG